MAEYNQYYNNDEEEMIRLQGSNQFINTQTAEVFPSTDTKINMINQRIIPSLQQTKLIYKGTVTPAL